MRSVLGALVTSALAALITVAAYAGVTVLAAAVGLTVMLVALGWAVLLELPDRRGTALMVVLGGWAGVAGGLWARDRARPLSVFAALVALAVLSSFGHELLRGGRRERLVESVTGTLTGQVVAILGAGWLLLPTTSLGVDGVGVAAVALAVTRIVGSLPLSGQIVGWVGLAAGGAAAAGAAQLLGATGSAPVVVGVAVAAVAAGVDRLLLAQPGARGPLGLLSGGAVPVAAVGTVAYAAALLVAR